MHTHKNVPILVPLVGIDFTKTSQYEDVSKSSRLAAWSEDCKWYSSLPPSV